MTLPPVARHVAERLRDAPNVVAAVVVAMVTVGLIVALFLVEQHAYSSEVNARDTEISRLANNYTKLRDQDFSLHIAPAAPSLAQVEDPGSATTGLPVPRSFTAAFPTGYFTCVDRTGEGNYDCTVSVLPKTTTTTVAKR